MPPESIATDAADPPSQTQPITTEPRRTSRVLIGLSIAVLLLMLLAAVPGYRWLQQRRTNQFKEACVAATQEKEWQRLGLIAGKWSAWDPASDDSYVYLAESQFQAGELSEAADSLSQVSDDYHGAVAALSFRGELLYGDLHRPDLAEKNWQRMLELDPKNTHAHQRLITFYAVSLQRGKMVKQIRESLERRCEPPEAYAYLLLANALSFTQGSVPVHNWRKSLPDDESLAVAEAIYAAKYQQNTTNAEGFEQSDFASGDQAPINACLTKYPHNLEVLSYHIERAMFYGDTAKVVELLASAPAEALADSRFWQFRGWLFEQAEDYEQAIGALEKSLEIDSFSWHSRWATASVLRRIGKTEAARQMQELAMAGKALQDKLYATDGRALTWGVVEAMRKYISQVDEPEVLAALDDRIRHQGGAQAAEELIGNSVSSKEVDKHP